MFQGSLQGIFITATKGGVCEPRDSGQLIAGRGLDGDRYFLGAKGSGPKLPTGAREVTLIEAEALEALPTECGLQLSFAEARRNLVTRGVPLNHLVGRTFRVGEAVLRGLMLCEPCSRLDKLTGQKLIRALLHRGGLRAEVVASGRIRVGDAIQPS